MKEKIIIFGIGYYYRVYFNFLTEMYDIICLTDNSEEKQNKIYNGIICERPEVACKKKVDKVIITCENNNAVMQIKNQIHNINPDIKVMEILEVVQNQKILENSNYQSYYCDHLNNEIFIADNVQFNQLNFVFKGAENKVIIGKNTKIENMIFACFVGNNNCLKIGKNCFIGSTNMTLAEQGNISIGDECMMSYDIDFQQGASHPFFDMQSGIRINYSKNIKVGNHVWIGKRVGLMSGFEIEDGSIVGYGSISSSKFGENLVIAGSPAKVIRKNVRWTKDYVGMYSIDSIIDAKDV